MVQIRRIFRTLLLIAFAFGAIGVVPSYADMMARPQDAQFVPICHCDHGCGDMCSSDGACTAICANHMIAVIMSTPLVGGGRPTTRCEVTKAATPIDRPPPLPPPNIRI